MERLSICHCNPLSIILRTKAGVAETLRLTLVLDLHPGQLLAQELAQLLLNTVQWKNHHRRSNICSLKEMEMVIIAPVFPEEGSFPSLMPQAVN